MQSNIERVGPNRSSRISSRGLQSGREVNGPFNIVARGNDAAGLTATLVAEVDDSRGTDLQKAFQIGEGYQHSVLRNASAAR